MAYSAAAKGKNYSPRVRLPRPAILVAAVFLIAFVIVAALWGLGWAPAPITPSSGPQEMDIASWETATLDGINQLEYQVTWQENPVIPGAAPAYHAPNRAQDLRTYFYPDGLRVVQRTEVEPTWLWQYQLAAVGRPGSMEQVAVPVIIPDGHRVEYRRGMITEWYDNGPDGLEQGFLIAERPAGSGPLVLEGIIGGDLQARSANDGQRVEFLSPGGVTILRYDSLRVTDARGRDVAASLNVVEDQLQIIIEDRDAIYPLTVDPLLTTTDWTAEGDQTNAQFGYSVASAGDVNGDGYDDVIIGAPFYDNGETDEGRAYLYLGSASGIEVNTAWTAEGDQINAQFGYSLAAAGDVNGDGYSDVVVGAPFYDNGETDEGTAYVYLGSASGLATVPAWAAESDQVNAQFGFSVASAGDVNTDSWDDVIVGSPSYDNGETDEGRVYVYHGSASGLAAAAAWTAESNQVNAQFGFSVAWGGDVNGDGYGDVIVGAPFYANGQSDEGRIYVYHGSASGLVVGAPPDLTGESDQAGAQLGYSVASAGNVNGDEYDDVIAGAPFYDNGETDEGAAFVWTGFLFLGPRTPSNAFWTAEGNQAGAGLGVSVGSANVNDDDWDDVLVGAWNYDNGQTDEGAAFLWYGWVDGINFGIDGNPDNADWTVESDQAIAKLGVSVALAGDVDGNGCDDVIVGANGFSNGETGEGRAFLHLCESGILPAAADWIEDHTQPAFGISVASAGDVNNDGYDDIIVGSWGYDNGELNEGAAFVYYGSESGLPSGSPITPDWIAESNLSGMQFGFPVAGAGNVNGDGFDDVIVGARNYPNASGTASVGRAFVWHGSSSGLAGPIGGANGDPSNAAWWAEGVRNLDNFGTVAPAGDVNGDGFDDVIIGAHNYHGPVPPIELGEGGVFLWYGSSGGINGGVPGNVEPGNWDWKDEGNQSFAQLGMSMTKSSGDVNGDGYDDIIVGAGNGYATTTTGVALVYHGSATGPSATPNWIEGTGSGLFGGGVDIAGDVNGDGFDDVIVADEVYANGLDPFGRANDVGAVYVYHGSASGLSTTHDWQGVGDQVDAFLGDYVAGAGDVNSDGFADIIASSSTYEIGPFDYGRVWVWLGDSSGINGGVDGDATTADWFLTGVQPGSRFGADLAVAGDVNGDGLGDIIVAAFQYNNPEGGEGRVYGYYSTAPTPYAHAYPHAYPHAYSHSDAYTYSHAHSHAYSHTDAYNTAYAHAHAGAADGNTYAGAFQLESGLLALAHCGRRHRRQRVGLIDQGAGHLLDSIRANLLRKASRDAGPRKTVLGTGGE